MTCSSLVVSKHNFLDEQISKIDRKKGDVIYKTRPFIKNIIDLMKTPSMIALQDHLKSNGDWKCLAMYAKLYSDLNTFFVKTHGKELDHNIAAFMIHHIMTDRKYRTVVVKIWGGARKQKRKPKLFDSYLPICIP